MFLSGIFFRLYYFFILTDLLCPFFANSFLYFLSLLEGTLIVAFLCMPLNAFLPTVFNFLLEILIVFSSLHLLNALLPIAFKQVLLIFTFLIFVHPSKALFPMDSIFFPIVTAVIFLLFLKAFFSIEVTV